MSTCAATAFSLFANSATRPHEPLSTDSYEDVSVNPGSIACTRRARALERAVSGVTVAGCEGGCRGRPVSGSVVLGMGAAVVGGGAAVVGGAAEPPYCVTATGADELCTIAMAAAAPMTKG